MLSKVTCLHRKTKHDEINNKCQLLTFEAKPSFNRWLINVDSAVQWTSWSWIFFLQLLILNILSLTLCHWIRVFLTCRPLQVSEDGVLSSVLFTKFTYDFPPILTYYAIIKFTDHSTAQRHRVKPCTEWCVGNDVVLNN